MWVFFSFFPPDLNICMSARSPDALIGGFLYKQLLPMSQPERGRLHSMVQDYFHFLSLPACLPLSASFQESLRNSSFKHPFLLPGVNTHHTFSDAHLLLIRFNGRTAVIMSIATCEKNACNYSLIIFLAI